MARVPLPSAMAPNRPAKVNGFGRAAARAGVVPVGRRSRLRRLVERVGRVGSRPELAVDDLGAVADGVVLVSDRPPAGQGDARELAEGVVAVGRGAVGGGRAGAAAEGVVGI